MLNIQGVGLGLRRSFIADWQASPPTDVDFLEVAPENWMGVGGRAAKQWAYFVERYPIVFHGLSLSLGGPSPLDVSLVRQVADWMQRYHIPLYSEHLSYCSDSAHVYDLLPIPFTEEAVHHVAKRIQQVQDILGMQMAVENASYYVQAPISQMDESAFLHAVLAEADCLLHLDVNNVYVDSVNHGFDPYTFIQSLPTERLAYLHVAGHYQEAPDLIIDTHGADVIDPVWQLLQHTYACHGVHPTLLERDFNIPPLSELLYEVRHIRALQQEVKDG